MRVKVCFTVDVDDEFRRALNSYYGKSGLATREEIRQHYETQSGSIDTDIINEFQEARERRKQQKESHQPGGEQR